MNIPQQTLDALSTLLDYLQAEEERDYLFAPPEERTGHIYESVLKVRRWLNSPGPEPDYFGGCPECGEGRNDGFLNIGRCHWFVCHIHRLRWCIGENLFSSWKHETRSDWAESWELIGGYREIPFP